MKLNNYYYIIGAALFMMASVSQAGYREDILDMNPVSYWRLGESVGAAIAVDQVGTGDGNNPGSYSGAVTREVTALIESDDTAVSFATTNEYITVANEGNFDFDQSSAFTVICWIAPEAPEITGQIVSKQGALAGWSLGLKTGKLRTQISQDSGSIIIVDSSIGGYHVGTNMIAMVYDPALNDSGQPEAADVKFYANGQLIATTNVLDSLHTTNSILNNLPLRLGQRANGADGYVGVLDEVAVFDRALSAVEVAAQFKVSERVAPRRKEAQKGAGK